MKLRNKKTGEIVEDAYVRETHDFQFDGQKHVLAVFKSNGHRPPERMSGPYNSLADLNEEWEDYEEPKEFWYIGQDGVIFSDTDTITQYYADRLQEIGNYFETKEEAEKTLEKLKALKRLKDKGFEWTERFSLGSLCGNGFYIDISAFMSPEFYGDKETLNDLDLLFGGEE